MFRTQAIILYIHKIRDSKIRIVLFSSEFGKITVWHKKNVFLDIGSIMEAYIERKGGHNHLMHYDLSHSWDTQDYTYKEILSLLTIFHTLYDALPDGMIQTDIYNDLSYILGSISTFDLREQSLLLFHTRILKQLGYIKESLFSQNILTRYIYKNITHSSMKNITTSKYLKEGVLETINNAVLEARNNFTYSI